MQLLELGLHIQVVSVFNTLWTWRFLFSKQGLAATVFVAAHKTISYREDLLPCAEKDGADHAEGSPEAQGANSEVRKVVAGRSVQRKDCEPRESRDMVMCASVLTWVGAHVK